MRSIYRTPLMGVILLSLNSSEYWIHKKFKGIPQNEVTFNDNGLAISVKKSSSPLFYSLGSTQRISAISAEGTISGFPKIPVGHFETQCDDYALRLGLVLEGEDTLSWLQKLFAPGWIQELIDLNPEKSFERVVFISISQQREPHTKTVHPKSDRIQEIVAIKPEGPGPFKMDYTFETALPVFAFWLQSDGDGTGSEFKLSLKSFNYTIEELASQ